MTKYWILPLATICLLTAENAAYATRGCACCTDGTIGVSNALLDCSAAQIAKLCQDGATVLDSRCPCTATDQTDLEKDPDCDTGGAGKPALPEWGLIALALLLLIAGTIEFGRRRAATLRAGAPVDR